ncbi:CIR protein, partial [Plasmodium chabaudi chabaudi]
MSAHVCKIFQSLYTQIPDEDDGINKLDNENLLYTAYCPMNDGAHGKCVSDFEKISAGFGYLTWQLFDNVNYDEEHEDQKDYYVYYGLMWVSYKLLQSKKNNDQPIDLYEFFNKYILNSDWYEDVKDYIEPKKNLVSKEVNIEHMSDIYYIFKQMCKTLSNQDDDLVSFEDFTGYYESVKSCAEKLKKYSKHDNTGTSNDQYLALYDMLKQVYDDFCDDYFKDKPKCNNIPDLPNFEEIKVTLESDLDKSDSQENTNEHPETQDGEVDNQQNKENIEELGDLDVLEELGDVFIVEKPVLDNLIPELSNIETDPPIFLDGIEVLDIESEFPYLEVEYPDVQEELFYIDTEFSKLEDDLPFFEVKYSDLENDTPNIVDELYVPENELSYLVMEPKNKDLEIPVLDFELPDLNIEQNDSDNQSQPHQTNTLEFDDPFKNPENFSDSIMCKLYGPKSVYCNRIICNRIKIGVIALSIPIVLVFVYKYFPWKRTKKPKKTKKMKKVINLLDRKKTKKIDIHSIDDKKTIQTIINSNDKKKTPKRIINSNDKEKTR